MQPMGYNLWLYSYNNPLYYTDPSGHVPVVDDCEFFGDCSDTGNEKIRINPVPNMWTSGYVFGGDHSCGPKGDKYHCFHPGTDVKGTTALNGIPIVAPGSGNVYFMKAPKGFGNFAILVIPLGNGSGKNFYHNFAHMKVHNEFSIEQGSFIEVGTRIGTVGNTGNSDGAHLHWEIRIAQENEFIFNYDSNDNLITFMVDAEYLSQKDRYYPQYQHQLDTYWVDPNNWSNQDSFMYYFTEQFKLQHSQSQRGNLQ